jgi:hypothetical protein
LETQSGRCAQEGEPDYTRRACLTHQRAAGLPVSRPEETDHRRTAWEKQDLSARGFKRVGRHSEHAIYPARRCVGSGPGGSSEPPEPRVCFSPRRAAGWRGERVVLNVARVEAGVGQELPGRALRGARRPGRERSVRLSLVHPLLHTKFS